MMTILGADVHGQRSRGRQRKRWTDVVKYNMEDQWSQWRTQGTVPNGEGEPMWLTPHQRDSQPEEETDQVFYSQRKIY